MKNTPIFITSKDRVTYLWRLIQRLEETGYTNIHIVDNGSTYQPMLEFLELIEYPVHRPDPTEHPERSLWEGHVIDGSGKLGDWYVQTDCDILPPAQTGWLEKLRDLLERYPDFPKAGLALRIDDLPDHYARKAEVIGWETNFWQRNPEPDVYIADIDTTLALYRPNQRWEDVPMVALRLGGPWQCQHLPWYENSSQPTEEEKYYKAHMAPNVGHWR